MDLELSKVISGARLAVASAIVNSSSKRLLVLQDGCPCKPGCYSCCFRLVYVSIAEAVIILDHLKLNGIWDETKNRCIALLKITQKSSPVSWFKMRIECPVLDPKTKTCTAYDVRPPPCSTHFVKSDPEGCDPWSLKPVEYELAAMSDIYIKYEEEISRSLDSYGILSYRLPMSVALLFAERIQVKKGAKISDIISFIYNELA